MCVIGVLVVGSLHLICRVEFRQATLQSRIDLGRPLAELVDLNLSQATADQLLVGDFSRMLISVFHQIGTLEDQTSKTDLLAAIDTRIEEHVK